jgi:hypothetical protein
VVSVKTNTTGMPTQAPRKTKRNQTSGGRFVLVCLECRKSRHSDLRALTAQELVKTLMAVMPKPRRPQCESISFL